MTNTLITGRDRTLKVDIVQVPISAPFTWLREGWLDMRRHWGPSLGYGALILALGWTLLVLCGARPYFVAAALLLAEKIRIMTRAPEIASIISAAQSAEGAISRGAIQQAMPSRSRRATSSMAHSWSGCE